MKSGSKSIVKIKIFSKTCLPNLVLNSLHTVCISVHVNIREDGIAFLEVKMVPIRKMLLAIAHSGGISPSSLKYNGNEMQIIF